MDKKPLITNFAFENGSTFDFKSNTVMIDGMKLSAMHFDEVETVQHEKTGDDRSPRYNWSPEELQKADPTHPDIDLDMPGYVMDVLQTREELEGRDPIPGTGEDEESISDIQV